MKSNLFEKLTVEKLNIILKDNDYFIPNILLNPIEKMLDSKAIELLNSEIIKEYYDKKKNKQ